MQTEYMSLGLLDLGGKLRYAFNDLIAIDGNLGWGIGFGSMSVGMWPITAIPDHITYPEDNSSLFALSGRMSTNIEVQVFNTGDIGMLVFVGPNFSYFGLRIDTKYTLQKTSLPFSTLSGITDTLNLDSYLSGYQIGIQLDIGLQRNIRFSPFIMATVTSGSVSIHDDPNIILKDSSGNEYKPSTKYSADIPSTTALSIGMDIYIDQISIGTLLQQLQAAESSNQDVTMIQISVSYNFSNRYEKISEEM